MAANTVKAIECHDDIIEITMPGYDMPRHVVIKPDAHTGTDGTHIYMPDNQSAQSNMLDVLSINTEDLMEHLLPEVYDAVEKSGLSFAVLERARKYMWNWMDNCSDWFDDCICEAADAVLDEQHVIVETPEYTDHIDDDIPFFYNDMPF